MAFAGRRLFSLLALSSAGCLVACAQTSFKAQTTQKAPVKPTPVSAGAEGDKRTSTSNPPGSGPVGSAGPVSLPETNVPLDPNSALDKPTGEDPAVVVASGTPATGAKPGGESSPTSAAKNLKLECSNESSTAPATQFAKAEVNSLQLAPACILQDSTTSTITAKQPLDIMFVVDVSTSMGPHFKALKDNILDFVASLTANNWDARLGAVTFVDAPVQTTSLTDAQSFFNVASKWVEVGGDGSNYDVQENGFSAIDKALNVFEADVSALPARSSAPKVLLYISDSVSFNGLIQNSSSVRSDFSYDPIAQKIKAKKQASLAGLQLSYSVATQWGVDPSGVQYKAPPAYTLGTPKAQLDALKQLVPEVTGKALSFPFTKSVLLTDFAQQFTSSTTSTSTSNLACTVASAGLFVTGVQSAAPVSQANADGLFELTSVAEGSYFLKLSRCCRAADAPAQSACVKSVNTTFSLVLK